MNQTFSEGAMDCVLPSEGNQRIGRLPLPAYRILGTLDAVTKTGSGNQFEVRRHFTDEVFSYGTHDLAR